MASVWLVAFCSAFALLPYCTLGDGTASLHLSDETNQRLAKIESVLEIVLEKNAALERKNLELEQRIESLENENRRLNDDRLSTPTEAEVVNEEAVDDVTSETHDVTVRKPALFNIQKRASGNKPRALMSAQVQPGKDEDEKHISRYFLTDCDTCDDKCDDVAIIGAGIAGTYAAWRLRDRGLSVSVYEFSDRIGGRLHTVQFPGIPDVNVELGGMRFLPTAHALMMKSAAALNLSVVDFAPGMGLGEDALIYLRGAYMRRSDLGNPALTPYNLKPNEQHLDPNQLMWEFFVNETSFGQGNTSVVQGRDMLFSTTPDGMPLYEQSTDVAYDTMGVSHEALQYLKDTEGYHFNFGDAIASERIPIRPPTGPNSRTAFSVMTIGEGMDALPKGFLKEFLDSSSSHKAELNHELWQILNAPDGTYQLRFWNTETTDGITQRKKSKTEVTKCAKKVILSVPRLALEKLDWEGFQDPEILKIIKHSVKDAPAAKIFLAYDTPWWKDLHFTFAHSVSDLPNRQTYDFGTSSASTKSVLLAGYMDMEDVKFWREVQSRDTNTTAPSGQPNALSDEAMFHATRFVSELFNVAASSIPNPIGSAIAIYDEFPYGGGWDVWMPGFSWDSVSKQILKPSDSADVYVATSSFAPMFGSAWAEFALERMDLVIDKMDKLKTQ